MRPPAGSSSPGEERVRVSCLAGRIAARHCACVHSRQAWQGCREGCRHRGKQAPELPCCRPVTTRTSPFSMCIAFAVSGLISIQPSQVTIVTGSGISWRKGWFAESAVEELDGRISEEVEGHGVLRRGPAAGAEKSKPPGRPGALGLAFGLLPCASPLQALLPEGIRGSVAPCPLRLCSHPFLSTS